MYFTPVARTVPWTSYSTTTTRPSSALDNQLIGRLKLNVVGIAPEPSHQISTPLDNAGPAGEVVEDLVDETVSDDVEEMLAINKIA